MPRDPRTDPRPGDVLRKGGVVRHLNGVTMFVSWYGGDFCTLEEFLAWARDAEVVHVAEEE